MATMRERQRQVELYRGQIPSPGRPTVAWRADQAGDLVAAHVDAGTLSRSRSADVVPAAAPSSMSAWRTHLRTDSTPNPNWSATLLTVP